MSNSWSYVPGDLLSQIVEHLSFKDLVRLGVICKTWRPIVLEAIRHHPTMNMPWLTLHDPLKSTMRIGPIFDTLFEPQSADQTSYSLKEIIASDEVKQLSSARVCASRYGWLLLFKTKPNSAVMYFYNPFLNAIIDNLPSLPLEIEYSEMHGSEAEYVARVTFTAPPTSPDCVIFVVSERRRVGSFGDYLKKIINIKSCSLKDGRWSTIHTTDLRNESNDRISAHIGDVVYIDGVLHCLYYTGPLLKMVTCNIALQDWTVMNYKYLESSPYFGTFEPYWPLTYCDVHPYKSYCLVESTDEDLLLAIRNTEISDNNNFIYQSYWQVYRFDLSKYEWTRIHSLGNQVLLVNEKLAAMAVRTEGEAMRFANMIVIFEGSQCQSFTCTEGNWRHHATFPLDKDKGYYSWIERPM